MPAGEPATPLQSPGLRRRLACFVYEGVLLFGVVMAAGLIYSLLTQQRHALVGMHGMQAAIFFVLALYFGWFWSHGGQTVAMKTWHIRLVDKVGQPVSALRALLRYLLSWLWFLPALAYAHFAGLKSGASIAGVLVLWALVYATLSRFDRQRQYVHDRLCGTQLVRCRPVKPAARA
jgi:uncharacterized RDD family membrane protein YckC